MDSQISVIVCTHNPRCEYLERVLSALKTQTLSHEQWELLLIDNASTQLLCESVDLSWHSSAQCIRENQLGLTPARLRGIQAAKSEILVFVDDDNVLDSDYLKIALQIANKWPMLGAWGGQAVAEFEEQPPAWTQPFWCKLAIREFDQDRWSNLLHQDDTVPYGAGLCIRKVVATKYANLVYTDPMRIKLGRTGKITSSVKSLMACEDIDMALTACDIGLGTGLFRDLQLTHLIPPNRLQEDYLLRLIEGLTYSVAILESFRGKLPIKYTWKSKLLNYFRSWPLSLREKKFRRAHFKGLDLAIKELDSNSSA